MAKPVADLKHVPLDRLQVLLSLARTRTRYGQTAQVRSEALIEVDAIKSELATRGHS